MRCPGSFGAVLLVRPRVCYQREPTAREQSSESFRLEKALKIVESGCKPSTAEPTAKLELGGLSQRRRSEAWPREQRFFLGLVAVGRGARPEAGGRRWSSIPPGGGGEGALARLSPAQTLLHPSWAPVRGAKAGGRLGRGQRRRTRVGLKVKGAAAP